MRRSIMLDGGDQEVVHCADLNAGRGRDDVILVIDRRRRAGPECECRDDPVSIETSLTRGMLWHTTRAVDSER